MKKRLVTATLLVIVSLSFLGVPSLDQGKVLAATATTQNNQLAVEAKADQLIQTGKSLIGKATYSNSEYKPTYPYKFSCATFPYVYFRRERSRSCYV